MIDVNIPTTIVIFGGTGDLSKTKLFPALIDLYNGGLLPDKINIVGFGRRDFSSEEYRKFVKEFIKNKSDVDSFLENIFYHKGQLDDINSYKELSTNLDKIEGKIGVCTNKLFYIAVPPTLYEPIFDNLAKSKLTLPCSEGTGWTRVLVEKPFGTDLETAQKLDEKLGKLFKEEQIFRIDHYLAKDAIQNLLTFRFSNTLFENSWNNKYIDKIHIKLYENKGIEGRDSFYRATGALRDVGQNHLLQMLAVIAMDRPDEINTLKKSRESVLKSLKKYSKRNISNNVIKGQYTKTDLETYFLIKTFINNKRWSGVPFYLESGKGLKGDKVEIIIYFKKLVTNICRDKREHKHQNILTLTLQPEQKVEMQFWTKIPGLELDLEPKNLSFEYKEKEVKELSDAYHKVLYDCIQNDQTLFVSTKEVKYSWEFIMSIIENWDDLPMLQYKKGSEGPDERINLLE